MCCDHLRLRASGTGDIPTSAIGAAPPLNPRESGRRGGCVTQRALSIT